MNAPYPAPFAGASIRHWIREELPPYPVREGLPASIVDVVRIGVHLTDPDRVLLFGSQARGTARRDSDFDLAFVGMTTPRGLMRLRADVEDEPITLRNVDLVDWNEASAELRQDIEREGIVVYERPILA